jgi:putative transcriptional regulator
MNCELKKLINIRKSKGYSVKKMADLLNISKTFYWQIEKGQRNLSYNMAIKISIVLNTKPDDIFYCDFMNYLQ